MCSKYIHASTHFECRYVAQSILEHAFVTQHNRSPPQLHTLFLRISPAPEHKRDDAVRIQSIIAQICRTSVSDVVYTKARRATSAVVAVLCNSARHGAVSGYNQIMAAQRRVPAAQLRFCCCGVGGGRVMCAD